MTDISSLLNRIDAEFKSMEETLNMSRREQEDANREYQRRFDIFAEDLGVWRELTQPRLDALAKKFSDLVKLTPRVTPSNREATFDFQTSLARTRLKFSAYADRDASKIIVTYDLDILPVFVQFESHAELVFRLGAIDKKALAQWLDDRIIGFVQTYLACHRNSFYLKEHMAEDPVAHVMIPKYAAAATLEHKGQTYYFINEDTRQGFERGESVEVNTQSLANSATFIFARR